jgi:gliding motility-associated-like protein
MKQYFFVVIFIFFTKLLSAQGGAQTCNELQNNPILYQSCATSVPFNNQTVANSENINPSCFSEPIKAPTWFFIKVKNSGDINLQISQISTLGNGLDVDFCIWGPFTSVNNVCGSLVPANEIDCSWLPASVENVQIPNAIQNQIYILLVDNYAQVGGTISISQTSGSGSSDCSFLSSVKIKDTNDQEITQIVYCKPDTKILKAIVNVTDFTANPANLRFNYRWKKDGVIVQSLSNSSVSNNTFTTSASGIYRVETAVYDVTDTSVDINNIPFVDDQSDEITLNFYETPVLNAATISVNQCDIISPNNDGLSTFNLSQLYNQLTNSTAGITLKYYLNSSLTQEILNPNNFTNTIPFAQNVFVVGTNPTNPITCNSNVVTINLSVTPTSITNYPNIQPICPELNQNFGLINFDAKRIAIKNDFFFSTNVDIQFYSDQIDATLEQNQLSNGSEMPIGLTTIYTKVKSGNNCSGIGTFTIEIKSSPILTIISSVNRCKSDVIILNSFDNQALVNQNPNVQVTYFNSFNDARDNVNVINKNTAITLPEGQNTIFVRLYNNATQCFSIINFTITIYANPSLNQNASTYAICGNITGIFNLNSRTFDLIGNNNYTLKFYETQQDVINNSPITNPQNYLSASKTIFVVATETSPANCTSQTTLKIEVNPKPGNSNNPTPFLACDNDGFSTFNLRLKEAEMTGTSNPASITFNYYENENDALLNNGNIISNPQSFTNSVKNFQRIYVRINNVNPVLFCFSILEITIYVTEFPTNNLNTTPYRICTFLNGTISEEAFIDTKLISLDYDFVWYNNFDALPGNEISGQTASTFSTPNEGNFSVKITSKLTPASCVTIANFTTLKLTIPRQLRFNPNEIVAFENVSQILAIANPASNDYEYLLNFGDWQSSPVLQGFKPGINTITVRNKFGCQTLSSQFLVADFKTFFTPNGDGFNDYWKIEGDAALDIASTYVFNKHGKLLYEHKKSSQGWDGTFNGQPQPADDYWFKIVYINDNESKEFRGHFTLKR